MYIKKLNSLTKDELEKVEQDLLKSGSSFEDIGKKNHITAADVTIVAINMGLIPPEETIPVVPSEDPNMHDTETKEQKKEDAKTRKRRVYLTDETRLKICENLESYMKQEWKGFDLDNFLEENNLSYSTLKRIAIMFEIKLPTKAELEVINPKKKVDIKPADSISKVQETKEETIPINADEFEKLSFMLFLTKLQNVNNSITVLLDSSVKFSGTTIAIFDKPVNKLTNSYDYDTAIKNFFNNYIVNKGIGNLKVVAGTSDINLQIGSIITKYCYANKINLTYIIANRELDVITEFGKNYGANFNYIFGKKFKKYLYNATLKEAFEANILYILNLSYRKENVFIICDSLRSVLGIQTMILEEFIKMDKRKVNGATITYSGSIREVKNGIPTDYLNFTNEKIHPFY